MSEPSKNRPLITRWWCCTVALLLLAARASAAELPEATPESVGMSSERLAQIDAIIQGHIDEGRLSGAVTAVARRGKVVHFRAHGLSDREARKPMPKDAIFRMASSSKPVTGVAIMILVEEGKLALDDLVHKFIPEFKGATVAVRRQVVGTPNVTAATSDNAPKASNFEVVPADREITIRDLLTHTSGLLSGGGQVVHPVEWQFGDTLATRVPRLGAVPLDFQPGTRWSYSPGAGIDTLCRIVEIVSGKTFDVFLRERIFEPISMTDTFFVIPENSRSRVLPL